MQCDQQRALGVGQREESGLVRLGNQRLAWTAHERMRELVVQQTECMAQLMGDYVPANHRISTVEPPHLANHDQMPWRVDARQRPRVRQNVLAREQHDDVGAETRQCLRRVWLRLAARQADARCATLRA